MTVLVIEDDDILRETLGEMLSAIGYRALFAADGYEGIEIFQSHPIDAVILDMRLPRLSGEETYQKLKAIQPCVKVIVSSGFMSEEECFRLMALGLDGIILKPYKVSDLRRMLAAVLGELPVNR